MPKVSDAHLESRRTQILDGARRAFARHGYEGATVARLEDEIGLSRGAIFNYYDSKLDLFVALAARDNARYQAMLAEKDVAEVVRAIAEESPEWLAVLIETEAKLLHDPEFQRRIATTPATRDRLLESFRDAQADGAVRDDIDVVDIVRFMSMVINGLALRVAGGEDTNIEPVIEMLQDALRPRK